MIFAQLGHHYTTLTRLNVVKHLHPFGVNIHISWHCHTPQNHLQNWCWFTAKTTCLSLPTFQYPHWRVKAQKFASHCRCVRQHQPLSLEWFFEILFPPKETGDRCQNTTIFLLIFSCFSLWVDCCHMNLLIIFRLHHSLSFKVEIHRSSVILVMKRE